MATDKPTKPECGEFQTVEWDEATNYWLIRDLTESELEEKFPPEPAPKPDLAEEARGERDRLLDESDWTQLPDAPVADTQAWVNYRQQLRDVPQQEGFPTDIDWPTKPE